MNRSLKRFPPGISDEERPDLQDQLTRMIVRVLHKHPDLHYYQGYHDVAITFLLVVGEQLGFHIVEKLSANQLKDFMGPTLERTTFLLQFMYPIVSLSRNFQARRNNSFSFPVQEGVSGVARLFGGERSGDDVRAAPGSSPGSVTFCRITRMS